jgi:hypothetical protein
MFILWESWLLRLFDMATQTTDFYQQTFKIFTLEKFGICGHLVRLRFTEYYRLLITYLLSRYLMILDFRQFCKGKMSKFMA